MPEVICDTSPLQYLHQLQKLSLIPQLAKRALVPPAVVAEIDAGRNLGLDLPDIAHLEWVVVEAPTRSLVISEISDLGPGEMEVLALALERKESVAVLDDAVARRAAKALGIRLTGTLGVLLDAKRAGLLSEITPILDRLQALGFRLAAPTRRAVLQMAGE